MAQQPTAPERTRRTGLQSTIEELTDGLSGLVRQHFELAKTELKQEAREYGRYGFAMGVAAAALLMGYAMANFSIVIVALWAGGVGAMAVAAIALTIVNLGAGIIGLNYAWQHLRNADVQLSQTTEELQRDKQWLKEIRDNSSRRLPAEAS